MERSHIYTTTIINLRMHSLNVEVIPWIEIANEVFFTVPRQSFSIRSIVCLALTQSSKVPSTPYHMSTNYYTGLIERMF
jgi:hypothetical protein